MKGNDLRFYRVVNYLAINHEKIIPHEPIQAMISQGAKDGLGVFLDLAAMHDGDLNYLYLGTSGERHAILRFVLICEFWKRIVDSKFKYSKCLNNPRFKEVPKLRKSNFFKAELELWIAVYEMLERMNSLGSLPSPLESTNLTFFHLIKEPGLLFSWIVRDGDISSIVKGIQHENKLMYDKYNENLFGEIFQVFAGVVIRRAMQLAETSDRFRVEFFTPMVKARGRVAQSIRGGSFFLHTVTKEGNLEMKFRRNSPRE